LARKSALNARAREDAIYVIDRFEYDEPKTSRLRALVDTLGVGDQKVLILTNGVKPNVFLSGRNLPAVHVMPYQDVSTYHLLWSDVVLIEAGALGQTLEPVEEREAGSGKREAGRGKREARSAKREARSGKREAAMKGATRSAAKKSAAKKSAAKRPAAKKSAAKKSAAKSTKKKRK